MQHRAHPRRPLDGETFDVVIIGGGINGVAIARQCALAGRRTLLVEQNDFASGTTSRSTRIIHGGLRYLEQGEISLVRESLRERERLLRRHGHLVRPRQFLLALPPGRRSALQVRLGLWLYRRFARIAVPPVRDPSELECVLDRSGSARAWNIFQYDDAQCEFPERLVAEWLVEALAAGAEARNHTEALRIEIADGRAVGVRLRDQITGCEFRAGARRIINATGPWADRVCRQSDVRTARPMIGGVRGSHLILSRFSGAPHDAVYTEAFDGRPIFLIPWNEQLLLGTTEVADQDDPASVQASAAETEYLMASLKRLFPSAPVGWNDVRCSFAGVRPLPYAPGQPAAAITRRHILHDHAPDGVVGMISIIGGKLTTAASLARECARAIGMRAPEPAFAAVENAEQVDAALAQYASQVQQVANISQESAWRMVEWYGAQALAIAATAAGDESLRQPVCDHGAHMVAEAVHACRHECAFTLADILLRRVPVALGACWSEQCTRQAAARVGRALQWDQARIAAEIEGFEAERAAFLVKPVFERQSAA